MMAANTHDAVLVVEVAGRAWAIELDAVAEVRSAQSLDASPAAAGPVLRRNGVAVPVYPLAEALGMPYDEAAAVVVLDLPDRIAAVGVDAVCEVRIPSCRSEPSPAHAAAMPGCVAWVASWEDGEAPVLDFTSLLAAIYAAGIETASS